MNGRRSVSPELPRDGDRYRGQAENRAGMGFGKDERMRERGHRPRSRSPSGSYYSRQMSGPGYHRRSPKRFRRDDGDFGGPPMRRGYRDEYPRDRFRYDREHHHPSEMDDARR